MNSPNRQGKYKMKRIVCIITIMAFLLLFTGCDKTSNLASGYYFAAGDYKSPYVQLDAEEREFTLCEGLLVSYAEIGTYRIRDGKLIASTQNTTFQFEIKDANTLELVKIKDDGFSHFTIGTQFIFSEDMK